MGLAPLEETPQTAPSSLPPCGDAAKRGDKARGRGHAPGPRPGRPEQPAMLTFTYSRSEHLCLIFTGSTVSISELQNFHAPGPALSKMHSGRLARWAINNLLYVLQMLHKRTVFYHGALTSGPLG